MTTTLTNVNAENLRSTDIHVSGIPGAPHGRITAVSGGDYSGRSARITIEPFDNPLNTSHHYVKAGKPIQIFRNDRPEQPSSEAEAEAEAISELRALRDAFRKEARNWQVDATVSGHARKYWLAQDKSTAAATLDRVADRIEARIAFLEGSQA